MATASEGQPDTAGNRWSQHLAAPKGQRPWRHYWRRTDDGTTCCQCHAEQLLLAPLTPHHSVVTDLRLSADTDHHVRCELSRLLQLRPVRSHSASHLTTADGYERHRSCGGWRWQVWVHYSTGYQCLSKYNSRLQFSSSPVSKAPVLHTSSMSA